MAEGPPAGRRPALDFEVGYGQFYAKMKIDSPYLAGGMVGTVALGALYLANPELVGTAVRHALAGFADRVLSILPSSVLVDLCFHTKERFLAFIDAFATGTVKQRLEEEFSKIGFKDELEVTVTLYDNASWMR